MKKHTIIFFVLTLSITLISCNKDSNPSEQIEDNSISNFENNFISEFQAKDLSYLQKVDHSFLTFPTIKNGMVIGRYIEYSDEEALYFDLSNYKKEVIVYNVFNKNEFQIIPTTLDLKTKSYKLDSSLARGGFWCKAACYIGAAAIAASDGPAPLMDALAVSYGITCIAACIEADK
ncbi:MAG: hypothetical protein OIF50_14340 [Flavobacteriaceae bacterium]|nr:hypothetical protein [Flavobacteriaceae bacterium]